jgi:galactose-1-phosphate uridylyltransferase
VPSDQQLDPEQLAALVEAQDVTTLSFEQLAELVREEPGLVDFRPDGVYQIDPRNGERIAFNAARARRPHDNRPDEEAPAGPPERDCVVCQGKTTGVIDVAPLSEGATFINKNLYPVLFPDCEEPPAPQAATAPGPACGLHLLQWTSSHHARDWHNMALADRVIVMERLAALEQMLLAQGAERLPISPHNPTGAPVFVSIIKNYGHLVGGSLVHGHQQIALSNLIPRRLLDNWRFAQSHGETFTAYILRENPEPLMVRDYGPAVLLVPYFMRRPYDMLLILKDVRKRYLHQLDAVELAAVADGWHDAIGAIRTVMPSIGREIAYNVVTHNGPGAGLYFEFLPYTQEIGGLEHLGLYVCQGTPDAAARRLRDLLSVRAQG